MNTEFQQNIENAERVLVMALWFMAFGGMVPAIRQSMPSIGLPSV